MYIVLVITSRLGDDISKRVGSELQTSFWFDHWVENISFKDRFSRLFTIIDHSDGNVGEIDKLVDDTLIWDLGR